MPLVQCPSCLASIPVESRFCLSCGKDVGSFSQMPTALPSSEGVVAVAASAARHISSDSIPAGGFTPGTILIDRYRIIGLLGRGGMRPRAIGRRSFSRRPAWTPPNRPRAFRAKAMALSSGLVDTSPVCAMARSSHWTRRAGGLRFWHSPYSHGTVSAKKHTPVYASIPECLGRRLVYLAPS